MTYIARVGLSLISLVEVNQANISLVVIPTRITLIATTTPDIHDIITYNIQRVVRQYNTLETWDTIRSNKIPPPDSQIGVKEDYILYKSNIQ